MDTNESRKDHGLLFPTVSLRDANLLAPLGELVARGLAQILDQLQCYDEQAVRSIAAIIEPYLGTDQHLYPPLPAIVTKDVPVTITKIEKLMPTASLDEEES
jgi:hypothetical protein